MVSVCVFKIDNMVGMRTLRKVTRGTKDRIGRRTPPLLLFVLFTTDETREWTISAPLAPLFRCQVISVGDAMRSSAL